MRRRALIVVLMSGWLAGHPDVAFGHAGMRSSDPEPGATLGDTPTAVRLSFSEAPDPSLSVVRVVDTAGVAHQIGGPQAGAGDSRSMILRVGPLDRGVYTVSWRIVSAVDGHATQGAYSFGVRATPTVGVLTAESPTTIAPAAEIMARSVLMLGLVILLGVGAGRTFRFAGSGSSMLAVTGWILAAAGLGLLAWVQLANAGGDLAPFLQAPIGRALIARAVAVASAGAALLFFFFVAACPQLMRGAMIALSGATLAAIWVHAAAGHAAAERGWQLAAMVASQWAHVVGVGVWIGGLAVLLLAMRGTASEAKAAAVRRFASVAAAGLLVVAFTGAIRSVGELSTWSDLISDVYGRTVAAKIGLAAAIAALGAANRWKHAPAASASLRGLRITGAGEIALAGCAVVAAATLGALAPPRAGLAAPRGLAACGADAGTTTRVCVSTASNQPGPNRFTVRAVDYDSRLPVPAVRVSLRFTSLEEPGLPSSTLSLDPGPDGTYVGSGANLAFTGRWRIDALVQRPTDSSEVPLEVESVGLPQFVSALRIPGEAPQYSVVLPRIGQVQFTIASERRGRRRVSVACFDMIGDEKTLASMVLTVAAEKTSPSQQSVRRTGRGTFVAVVQLHRGVNTLVAAGRLTDGTRIRAVLEVNAR